MKLIHCELIFRKQHEVPDYILKELDSITGTGEFTRQKNEMSDDESYASTVEQEHMKQGRSKSPRRKRSVQT